MHGDMRDAVKSRTAVRGQVHDAAVSKKICDGDSVSSPRHAASAATARFSAMSPRRRDAFRECASRLRSVCLRAIIRSRRVHQHAECARYCLPDAFPPDTRAQTIIARRLLLPSHRQ